MMAAGSPVAPLLAKLRPKLQPFSELALEPARRRIIELLPGGLLREIVLTGECIRRIVIVPIILAITFRAHQPGGRVENVLGGKKRACLLGSAHGALERDIGRIR